MYGVNGWVEVGWNGLRMGGLGWDGLRWGGWDGLRWGGMTKRVMS